RAAQTKARAMPVLPLVGSTRTVSLVKIPAFSAASTMLTPILSFTLPHGLKNSSFATISASNPPDSLLILTSGVFPTNWVMSRAIFIGAYLPSCQSKDSIQQIPNSKHEIPGNAQSPERDQPRGISK